MDSDIDSTTTAVKDHHYAVFHHLCFNSGFTVLSALNACTLRLKTQQEMTWVLVLDNVCFFRSLSHEKFVFFTPKSWHCQDPPNLCFNDFSYLLGKFLDRFLRDIFQTLWYDFHQRKFAPIQGYSIGIHV